ncbi:splicing factor U2af large subunit B [Ananas comosus]|uniref:Splicing factor U2af large subunit B n=1 Tax=Ananas comosus TaxID=4615 RepID=A0A6P5FGF6_ANACO|nr:splicing factor U2af large subunit B [Ananas comosus]
MSRTNRSANAAQRSSNEGTSARTRPFSFEEIMLRREKKLRAATNERDIEPKKPSRNGDRDKGNSSNLKPLTGEQRMPKARNEDAKFKMREDSLKGKRKGVPRSEVHFKGESGYTKATRDKESKNGKFMELRNDERESRKKQRRETAESENRRMERDGKSTKEANRKTYDHDDKRYRSQIDMSIPKKHGSGKSRDSDYMERNDRRKEHSKPHYEELRSNKRRSVSLSPRAQHKGSYHVRGNDESAFHSSREKLRRKYSEGDSYRTSKNGEYASGHHRKHESGLGGYSPRKRKTEATITAPSPTARSPKKKAAKWDQLPAEAAQPNFGTVASAFPLAADKPLVTSSSIQVAPATTKPETAPSPVEAMLKKASVDSVQLTQATRPLRRLYIENIPTSTSERTLIDCLNDFLLSSGVNHIQGTKPCLSCIINKEKCQALVEFLTPEDATAALSFDGKSLSGSALKIRRPKDYVETASAAPEKSVEEVKAITDVVKDSPHKIFVAGISKALSSEMLMEIVSAFGPLGAFRFEYNEELDGPCAFLEYIDHSSTLKACAGLNGMKLGGCILTVVQALPDAPEEGNNKASLFYGIPMHARPLLAESTKVLQLKNVFYGEEFLLLSKTELEETLEDIRIECARFGTVKSVNVVRHSCDSATEAVKKKPNSESGSEGLILNQNKDILKPTSTKEIKDEVDNSEDARYNDKMLVQKLAKKELHEKSSGDEHTNLAESMDAKTEETGLAVSAVSEIPTKEDKEDGNTIAVENSNSNLAAVDETEQRKEDVEAISSRRPKFNQCGIDEVDAVNIAEGCSSHELDIFEPGSVLVEFMREEATGMAARCLHGRLYGERVVSVGYVPHDVYLARFPR